MGLLYMYMCVLLSLYVKCLLLSISCNEDDLEILLERTSYKKELQTKLEFHFRILTLLSSGNLSVKEKVLFAVTRFPHFDAFVCVTKLAAVLTELHDVRAAGSRCDSRSLATPSKYYTFKKFWCTLVRGRRLNCK